MVSFPYITGFRDFVILVNKDVVSCVLRRSSVLGSRVLLVSITNWNTGPSFVFRGESVSLKWTLFLTTFYSNFHETC